MKSLYLVTIIIFTWLVTASASQQPRYVSLAPATTEILFALGLSKQIIGDTVNCNYPEEAKFLPKVGSFSDPNIEKIIFLKPDIVFATGLEQSPAVTKLKKANLRVIVSDPKNLAELFDSIGEIGFATRRQAEASALMENMREEIRQVKNKARLIPENKKKKVFIEIWYDPIMTAGKGSFVDELISLAGGINIAYDTPRAYSRFSAETIIQRNPDVIILGYMSQSGASKLISRRLGWQSIKAIKNGQVIFRINPDLILRPGPRIAEGLKQIYDSLYNQ